MEQDILFKNTSKMEEAEISLFQSFALKKMIWIMSICFALVFVAIGVVLALFVDLTGGIITIACGVIGAFVLLPYLMKENIKKQNQKNFDGKKYLNTFVFYDDNVSITTEVSREAKGDFEEVGSQKLFYNDVFKMVIYKEHLFIFINESQSFVVSFKGMTKGTVAELIDFLKSKNIKTNDKSA